MNNILSNPIFVAGFNALDKAGPIAQLGLCAVAGIAAAAAVGFAIDKAAEWADERQLAKIKADIAADVEQHMLAIWAK